MTVITVSVQGKTHPAIRPEPRSEHVEVAVKCPFCGALPLCVKGEGSNIVRGRDSYQNFSAVTLCCKKPVDWIKSQMDTIFGLEEDERVLNGPWKVYR